MQLPGAQVGHETGVQRDRPARPDDHLVRHRVADVPNPLKGTLGSRT
ncbi:hypothetical protein [Kribbella pittospori]|nr:hypothetical protein [Kribbella pittospori]